MPITRTTDVLYPPFAQQIAPFLEKARVINAFLFESLRSFEQQQAYYSQGRRFDAQTNSWIIVDPKKIVTKAMPGYSWHAYGVAIDMVFDGNPQKQGIQWSWDDADLTTVGKQPLPWKTLGQLGKQFGLEWAGDWISFPEMPHFQNSYKLQIQHAHDIYLNGGLKAVWAEFDRVRTQK
jgi:peptidoglycan LD-endopeptidase CwlK